MSSRLAMAVLESDLPRSLKPTAVTLALFANDDGERCFPSVSRIAWLLSKTPKNVSSDLTELCEVGVLIPLTPRSGGRGRATDTASTPGHCPRVSHS